MRNKFFTLIAILVISLMTGCATTTNKDPLEGLNRGIYKFNDVADKAVFKPVAGAYKAVAPTPVQTGISNFFANLRKNENSTTTKLKELWSDDSQLEKCLASLVKDGLIEKKREKYSLVD